MKIRELAEMSERQAAVPILRQLWTEKTHDEVLAWTGSDEYHLFGRFVEDELVGVAGVLLTHVLHHARHAWLYDLVVDEPRRGNGHRSALIRFVEEWAETSGCEYVALVSPKAKSGVHEYYEGREYEKWGYVIEKKIRS